MFLEQIQDLYSELKSNNKIELHSYVVYPALPAQKIKQLQHDFNIPEHIISFYAEVNGFQISYTFKDNKDFNKEKFGYYDAGFPALWPNENYWHLDGCINFLPIDFILLSNWENYIWFPTPSDEEIVYDGQKILQSQFEKNIRPLDVFSKESIATINLNQNSFNILLSTDHNASFTDYFPISFHEYFTGVLKIKGIIDKRRDLFNQKT